MLKNDGLERSWRHLGPMLAPKGVKMSFGRLHGRFLVLFWAVKAPFGEPLELPGCPKMSPRSSKGCPGGAKMGQKENMEAFYEGWLQKRFIL